MSKTTAASISFEDRDFTTAQTQQILSCGKTTFFLKILPELERDGYVYWEGSRRKINGRGILAYRERKRAEPPRKRPVEHLPNVKKRRSRKLEESRRTEARP
jgi:hypothetical protein